MSTQDTGAPRSLSISLIDESTTNPRVSSWGNLEELAASIREHGVVQAVIVRRHPIKPRRFELVLGARRLRASKIAGVKSIPSVIRELDDRQVLELQIVENSHRQDVDPVEEGGAFAALVERYGLRVGEVADKIGRGHAYVSGRLRLAQAEPAVRKLLADGRIGIGGALALAQASPEQQAEAAERLAASWGQHISKVEVIRLLARSLRELRRAPWSLDDDSLAEAAPPCRRCPETTAAQAEIFGGELAHSACLNGQCWARKLATWTERAREDAATELVEGEEAAKAITSWGGVEAGSPWAEASTYAPIEAEWPREAELREIEELLDTREGQGEDPEFDRTLEYAAELREERRQWIEANRLTWAEVAAKAGRQRQLLVGSDTVVEVIPREERAEILEAAGYTQAAEELRSVGLRSSTPASSGDKKASAAEEKRRREELARLVEKIVNMAAIGLAADGTYAANVALIELWSRRVDRDLAVWICKRRGWAREATDHPAEVLVRNASSLTTAGQLRGLLVEMSLGHPGGWLSARSPLEIAAAGVGVGEEHLGVLR